MRRRPHDFGREVNIERGQHLAPHRASHRRQIEADGECPL